MSLQHKVTLSTAVSIIAILTAPTTIVWGMAQRAKDIEQVQIEVEKLKSAQAVDHDTLIDMKGDVRYIRQSLDAIISSLRK